MTWLLFVHAQQQELVVIKENNQQYVQYKDWEWEPLVQFYPPISSETVTVEATDL